MLSALKHAWQRLLPWGRDRALREELSRKYAQFQRLLTANNQTLTLMADMEEKLSGDFLFDFQYVSATATQLRHETGVMVEALNALGGNRYQALTQAWARVCEEVEQTLTFRREIPSAPLVLSFDKLDEPMADIVGEKSAHLGEAGNWLKLPVPPGFAVSIYGYKVFLDYNHLSQRINELLTDRRLDDLDSLHQVSQESKEMILAAEVPPELHQAMLEAYDRLAEVSKGKPLLAMRPSLVGEELAHTFADRYGSHLNLPAAELEAGYKSMVASLFTPRAMFYYKNKGFKEEELAGGVLVLAMIQAKASGVLCTRRPQGAGPEAEIIAGWGLAKGADAGPADLDRYLVAYQPRGRIKARAIAAKPTMLVCRPDAGLEEVPVRRDYVDAPCLNEAQLLQLLGWAEALEAHYHHPQKLEWAADWQDQLWLLQVSPLTTHHHKAAPPPSRALKQYPVLLDQGVVAYRGVAAGPVVLVLRDEDLENFPEGGVLVIRHSSPKYATVMPKAAAIIIDTGSPTGHMALLAREFQIPTIINARTATQVLKPGQQVTVDANYNNVYAGVIPELLQPREEEDALGHSPVFQALKALVKQTVPLNLINPQDEATFAPEHCRTLHDVVRYAHEVAMREMFKLTESEDRGGLGQGDLESGLRLRVRILDLGGALKQGWGRKVRPQQVASGPFLAFWEGLTAARGAKPPGAAPAETLPWAQSYLVLASNYMNFRVRMGYHLFTVEAYVSQEINDNYLTFSFQGGAADPERREGLVRLLTGILERLDFSSRRQDGAIEARLAKYPPERMAQVLVLLGRLTRYTKQLDLAPLSESLADWHIQDFLQQQGRSATP